MLVMRSSVPRLGGIKLHLPHFLFRAAHQCPATGSITNNNRYLKKYPQQPYLNIEAVSTIN